MADEQLKPEADAPPGASAPPAEAAAAAPAPEAPAAGGADETQDARIAKASKAKALEAATREPARKTAVAKILRGHFYEGDDYRHPVRKGPGEMIELPIAEIERFQQLGLLEDKRRIIPTTMVGPQFFRDDAPGR